MNNSFLLHFKVATNVGGDGWRMSDPFHTALHLLYAGVAGGLS